MSSIFKRHLERMREIHDRKSRDYSTDEDRHANYHRQAVIIGWFQRPEDQAFASRIAEKLSRLATLLNKEYDANRKGIDKPEAANEPLDDTFLDLCTISNIWWTDWENLYRPLGGDSNRDETTDAGVGNESSGSLPESGRKTRSGNSEPRGAAEKDQFLNYLIITSPVVDPNEIGFATPKTVEIVEMIRRTHFTRFERDWIIRELQAR